MSSKDTDALAQKPIDKKKVIERTWTAIVMTLLYMALLMSGHLYCIITMVLIQVRPFANKINRILFILLLYEFNIFLGRVVSRVD